ncbi:EpsG family protein [Paraburkholderia sp. J7]|uniref:EpsG family protein n=1 Tax=Paraburkholderia sp. J7 TaxID=2805438 RepID=UPI002AB69C9F|nr:EpsG family protein [Paraburkholderia sp. J7]
MLIDKLRSFSWDRRGILAGLILVIGFFLAFPFASFLLLLAIVVLTSSLYRTDKWVVLILCVYSVVAVGPLLALKLPIEAFGNDKSQYLDFMSTMGAAGADHFIKVQPELVSFFSLYCAWKLFGATDAAFLFLFVASFTLAIATIWKGGYQSLPLFILLILSSSAFYASYGNVIRQAMAFPFIFLLIFEERKRRLPFYMILAMLAHIPSLIITVPYFLCRILGRYAFPIIGVVTAIAFIAFRYIGTSINFLSSDDGYVSKKMALYTNWESYSIVSVAIVALTIAVIVNIAARQLLQKIKVGEKMDGARYIGYAIVMSNICVLGMMAAYSIPKVFERIYIYFFVIAMLTLSMVISRMAAGQKKVVLCCVIVIYSTFGISKNIAAQNLLYHGNSLNYFTDNLFDIYNFLF